MLHLISFHSFLFSHFCYIFILSFFFSPVWFFSFKVLLPITWLLLYSLDFISFFFSFLSFSSYFMHFFLVHLFSVFSFRILFVFRSFHVFFLNCLLFCILQSLNLSSPPQPLTPVGWGLISRFPAIRKEQEQKKSVSKRFIRYRKSRACDCLMFVLRGLFCFHFSSHSKTAWCPHPYPSP